MLLITIIYRVQMDYILKDTSARQYSSIIITVTSAIMNLICSVLLSQFYYWMAEKTTDLGRKKKNNYFFLFVCAFTYIYEILYILMI